MDDVAEKRVFDDRTGGEELVVAARGGVVSVAVASDRVGRFGVVSRCVPADVAAAGGRLAVATGSAVLHREPGEESFADAGFGPAVAVGFMDGGLVAAGPDGRVAEWNREGDRAWTDLGRVDGTARAIDGRLLAASTGVYRLPGLDFAGLDDVRDVAAAGPLAASRAGLYSLGNGWMVERDGDFRAVASDGERAHAATADVLVARRGGRWVEVALPVDGPVADVAYGAVPYAVTTDGVVLAEGEDGWRATPLGVGDVVACAVA